MFRLKQSDVRSSTALLAWTAAQICWLWCPASQRAVGNSDGTHQSPTLPAGWCSHILHYGSGEGHLICRWSPGSPSLPYRKLTNSSFLLWFRSSQKWRAVWISCAASTMCSDSPSNCTSPRVRRSSWETSLCGTRLKRYRDLFLKMERWRLVRVNSSFMCHSNLRTAWMSLVSHGS